MIKPRARRVTGGCLCGAVRYSASVPPSGVHYCHCRICQRAFGNVFAIFGSFPKDKFRFTLSKPRIYRSSAIARRGFCGRCGTPLLTEQVPPNGQIGISVGSLDHPERVRPEIHWGSESEIPWLKISDRLPHKHTMDDPAVAAAWQQLRRRRSH
ncbi:MAG: GFA family protein [Candidatus Binataceae bacterium]